MLIVAGYSTLVPGEYEKIQSAVRKVVEESRKEPGCIEYCFARDILTENTFRLFEIWESREALDRHVATPHFAEFNKAISAAKVESVSIKIYEVSGVQTMAGA